MKRAGSVGGQVRSSAVGANGGTSNSKAGENNGGTTKSKGGRAKSLLPLPPRSSSGMPSSSKGQSSMSRLPAPGSKVKPNTSSGVVGQLFPEERGRSRTVATPLNKGSMRSSSGNRSSERLRGNPRTDYMTPQGQRLTSTASRKSMTSAKRMLLGASAGHQRLSGRGSQIGTKGGKDTRPLSDKTFQQSQIRKILDFLRKSNYPNQGLTSKSFPLSSKEFVGVFNFLYSFIDPRTESLLQQNKFDEEVVKVLKLLHYPSSLSRSSFITMGSLHSWPTVLGCLAFVCDLANIYSQRLLPDIVALGFPSKDGMGFDTGKDSREKIQFEHHLVCWQEFNNGADEFPTQLAELKGKLMQNGNLDEEHLESLKQEKLRFENEVETFKARGNMTEQLIEQKETLQSDLNKMIEYLKVLDVGNHEKEGVVKEKCNELEVLTRRVCDQEAVVTDLMLNCEKGKVSSLEVEKSCVMIKERKIRVESARREAEELEKEVWQKEMLTSRKLDILENLAKQINSLALEEGIKDKAGDLLSLKMKNFQSISRAEVADLSASSSFRAELNEKAISSRALTRNADRELQKIMQNSDLYNEKLIIFKKDLSNREIEVTRLDEATVKFKEEVACDELEFNDQISSFKVQLHEIKSDKQVNLDTFGKELMLAESRLEKIRKIRNEERINGQEFLRKIKEKTLAYIEENTGYRDVAAKAVYEALQHKKKMVERAKNEMEAKVEQVLKQCDV